MATSRIARCFLFSSILTLAPEAAEGQADDTRHRQEFEKRRLQTALEAGNRHLELGVWCRDSGLVPQATAEFLRAVEASENRHPGASYVLSLMRKLDDAFWKRRLGRPGKAPLNQFEKKSREAFLDDQRARLGLARFAQERKLAQEAHDEFVKAVRAFDEPLKFDAKGRLVLEIGSLPEDVSRKIRDEAISINGQLYLRDEFLQRIPQVREIFEASSERVRVRCQTGAEEASALLDLTTHLLPHLEDELGGRPTRRLGLFVAMDRKTYDAYLEAAGLSGHKAAQGIADARAFVALVCAEGLQERDLQGTCLHELSHLFQMGITPAVMPSWYSEGFAETFGGPGTFAWDGKTLTVRGILDREALALLRSPGGALPLSELIEGNSLGLLQTDKTMARRFYAQSWAFLRFLRSEAGKEIAEKLDRWETMCRGAALGAEAGKPRSENSAPAAELFQRLFGNDLADLEKGFPAFLASL